MGFFELFSAALTGLYALVPSYGLAIILLTVCVRILLLPLSIKQTRSMRETQKLQPEIQKLRQKHKGDRQKMNEELMALYKEHGVNPFGGCGPLVLQFPVLIGLFYVIRAPLKYMGYGGEPPDWTEEGVSGFVETLQNSNLADDLLHRTLEVHNFLGLRLDCTASLARGGDGSELLPSDPCGTSWISALPYLVLVALMGVSTWYQQRQMQATRGQAATDDASQQTMQMMGKLMPVMLMVFAFTFPAGVVLYWITTTLWTIVQQRLVLKAAPPLPVETVADKAGPKSGDGKAAAKGGAKGGAKATAKSTAKGGAKPGSKTDAKPGSKGAAAKGSKSNVKGDGRSSGRSAGSGAQSGGSAAAGDGKPKPGAAASRSSAKKKRR